MAKKRNIFDSIRLPKIGSNVFDLSHDNKLSLDFGKLVPVYVEEVLPGDKFRVNPEMFIRLAPLTAPVMQRFDAYLHFFFVPNRIMWKRWEEFITGGREGTSVVDFPTFDYAAIQTASDQTLPSYIQDGSLCDYIGLPTLRGADPGSILQSFSALPFFAYQLIYDNYYRDQNLTEPVIGPDEDVEDLLTKLDDDNASRKERGHYRHRA